MADDLVSLRSERRALREEIRTRQLRREVKAVRRLTESYDYFDRLVDVPDRWIQSDRLIGPAGTLQDRRDGQNAPVVRTLTDLELYRGLARVLCQINYIAIGLRDRLTDFVIDTGIKFRAAAKVKGHDKALRELIFKTQAVIDEFWERTAYDALQREVFRESLTDGEWLLRMFTDLDRLPPGYTDVRSIWPEQLRVPMGESGVGPWSFGIYNDPCDIETPIWYHAVYLDTEDGADGMAGEDVPSCEVVHRKRNVVRRVKRGFTDFFPVAEDLEGVRKLMHNMNVTSGVQAAIAWVRQFEGTLQSDVERLRTDNFDFTRTDPGTQRDVHFQRTFPGMQLDVPKGMQMAGAPAGTANVAGHVQVIQAMLRGLTSRWGMPEYFTGDASNNNYASILVAGSPFVRKGRGEQMDETREHLKVIWYVLKCAILAGRLPPEVTRLLTVQTEASTLEITDPLAVTQKRSIEIHDGVLSPQTAAAQAGYDADQEMMNIEEYQERFPQQGMGPLQIPPAFGQPPQ